jgi:hypothetical protein
VHTLVISVPSSLRRRTQSSTVASINKGRVP